MFLLAWFHALDLHWLYLINQTWSSPRLDPLMARVSDFDSWRYPLIAAVMMPASSLTVVLGSWLGRTFEQPATDVATSAVDDSSARAAPIEAAA